MLNDIDNNDNLKLIDSAALSKLKWRARRGLLENDIVLSKFFNAYEHCLNYAQAKGLEELLDLSDNDLLDLILKRKHIDQDNLNQANVLDIIQKLQDIS
jgi:antitoxin CptB